MQDDDEENEEEGDGGEGEYEEMMVNRNLLAAFLEEETPQSTKRRAWDDEFVLKRQFSALIPAFDPRPGRTNINQVCFRLISTNKRIFIFRYYICY